MCCCGRGWGWVASGAVWGSRELREFKGAWEWVLVIATVSKSQHAVGAVSFELLTRDVNLGGLGVYIWAGARESRGAFGQPTPVQHRCREKRYMVVVADQGAPSTVPSSFARVLKPRDGDRC